MIRYQNHLHFFGSCFLHPLHFGLWFWSSHLDPASLTSVLLFLRKIYRAGATADINMHSSITSVELFMIYIMARRFFVRFISVTASY